jgi:hypothetical protein
MSPRPFSRSINVAVLLLICAVILSARVWFNHVKTEAAPPATEVETPIQHPDTLPPVW